MKIHDNHDMPASMKEFQKLVRELMERDGLTMRELVALVGREYAFDYSTVRNTVSGKTQTPRVNLVMALAKAFNLEQDPAMFHRFVNAYFFTQFPESWLNMAGFSQELSEP